MEWLHFVDFMSATNPFYRAAPRHIRETFLTFTVKVYSFPFKLRTMQRNKPNKNHVLLTTTTTGWSWNEEHKTMLKLIEYYIYCATLAGLRSRVFQSVNSKS